MRAFFSSFVIRGLGFGKKLGFPTLNLSRKRIPKKLPFGIYAGKIYTSQGNFLAAIHYGPRPTIAQGISFEIHCLGLKKNLSVKHVKVEIEKKIRRIQHFPNFKALKKAIEKDIEKVKKLSLCPSSISSVQKSHR